MMGENIFCGSRNHMSALLAEGCDVRLYAAVNYFKRKKGGGVDIQDRALRFVFAEIYVHTADAFFFYPPRVRGGYGEKGSDARNLRELRARIHGDGERPRFYKKSVFVYAKRVF